MSQFVRVAAFAVAAAAIAFAVSAEDKKEELKGEKLKTIISVAYEFDKDKKTLAVTAVGQVPTGGWKDAKLTPRKTKDAPKDGIYEYDLTAVRPTGIVTQVISKVKAEHKWENPPADIKGVKVYGEGDGAKTVKFEK
jgi:hypothetical protein